ncbi:putative ribonuclease H-like domain-containing protein [Tanacetum coccineum]
MLMKPQFFYDHTTKQALGFQNPFYQKKAQQLKPKLYDGNVIKNTSAIVIPDSEETLMLAKESRSKILLKQKDPMMLEKKNSVNTPDPTLSSRPTKVEVPKELPKVSMVNMSLKKLKHHLAGFDMVVKERTTTTTITERSWGFEHTKACFKDEIIPFVKALKDLFNTFDQYLIDELSEVQNIFHQMEQAVEQHYLESKTFKDQYLIDKLSESMEISDLNASLQEIFLVITALKDDLRKLKGKALVDNAIMKYTIDPEMLKIDVEPITPKLLNKKTSYSAYIKHTQKEATIFRDLVEHVKSKYPLDHSLKSACRYIWRPTGRTFTKVGNVCPLTKITITTEVPLRKPTVLDNEIPKHVVTLVYSWKPRKSKTNVPANKYKVLKSVSANKKEPSQSWGSIVFDVPSSSLDECRSSKLFSGTVKFGNDHVAKILGYGDYQIGNVTISRVYYVEGLGHNLFFVGQFCDSNLEVAFRQHTCFIRNLEGVDLLTGSQGNNLYTLSLRDMMVSSLISRHGLVRGLPKLKFEKDHLYSACAMGKRKKKPHKPKSKDTNQEKLYLLHMDLCVPMRVASVNEMKIKIDNGTEFVNQTLREYYEKVGISHETSVARSPKQNGVVKRCNRTLIKVACTMLIYAKAPLCLWAKAVVTVCYTQNRFVIRLCHGKTPYEILHDKLPDLLFFNAFGALCYPTNDSENLGKLLPKADIGIFIDYAPIKKVFRIYNRCTRRIIETIHVDFDELTAMASEHNSSGSAFHEMTPATISSGLVPNLPPSTLFVPPLKSDWDFLFQSIFDKLLTPLPSVDHPAPKVIALIAKVVAPEPAASTGSPSSTTIDQDAPSPSNSQTTPETQSPIISNHVEEDNHDLDIAHMNNDPFFGIPIAENNSEASSLDVIPTVVYTATPNSEHIKKWTKDHPLDNIIGELERPVSTRLQIHEQSLFCYFDAFLTSVEPKNYKDALTQACWIEAMQEELHEFDHLKVWKLVPRPNKVMIITLKWIYKVKLDEIGGILKNKAHLVAHGLQISQSPRGIFLNQSKYALESLKKYGMESSDPVDTPMVEKSKLDEDTQGKAVDPTHYHGMISTLMYLTANVDHASFQDTRRSTSGCMHLLGDRLVNWSSKRQKSTLTDYDLGFNKIPMYCDNKSAIVLCCNNVQHSHSKHIHIRFYFIKEIKFLINKLGMRSFTLETLKQFADEAEE